MLCLPNLLFFLFWLKWWLSLPLSFVLLWLLVHLTHSSGDHVGLLITRRRFPQLPQVSIAVALGALWAVFAGYFGLLFGWTPDWNDLRADYVSTISQMDWPVAITTADGPRLMVGQLGLYLVPAFVTKVTRGSSLLIAQFAIATYVALLVALVIYFVLAKLASRREQLLGGVIFLTFGGFDVVGVLARQDSPWEFILKGGHIQPWDGMLQLSNVTTLIFWVPHHALASWLGVVVLSHFRGSGQFRIVVCLVSALTLLWSPFTAVGLLVVGFVFTISDSGRRSTFTLREVPIIGLAILLALPTIRFYSLVEGVDIWWFFSQEARDNAGLGHISVLRQFLRYVFFWSVQIGAWIWIARMLRFPLRAEHYLSALALLILSQLVSWGPNDFMMRSVIAPHFVFSIPIIIGLAQLIGRAQPKGLATRVTAGFIVLLMSVTALVEIVENYRRGPRRLSPPCLTSGCKSNITDPLVVGSFAEGEAAIFQD